MFGNLIRNRLVWVAGAVSLALVLYLALGVFGVQTLFYDTQVNEDFPVAADQTSSEKATRQSDSAPEAATTQARPEPVASDDEERSEPTGPVLVSSGQFHAVTHSGTGDVLVYRLADGSHVLRLENIDIYNGPALYVYAVAAPDANDAETVLDAGFVSAGPLEGNQGSQTYKLPTDFDPEVHRSVSVWCERFSVNFATAPLS